MPKTGKQYRWFSVPAGTPQARCRDCLSPVYWIDAHGRRVLIDCDVANTNTKQPTPDEHGQGIPHFDVCPSRRPTANAQGSTASTEDHR